MGIKALAKVVFRRIRGRLVPIRVSESTSVGVKEISFESIKNNAKGHPIASGSGFLTKGNSFYVGMISVKKSQRGKGIGKGFFKSIVKDLNKRKINQISGKIGNPAQIKIRSKYNPTTFTSKVTGKKLSIKEAIKATDTENYVNAITDLKKFRQRRNLKRIIGGSSVIGTGAYVYHRAKK